MTDLGMVGEGYPVGHRGTLREGLGVPFCVGVMAKKTRKRRSYYRPREGQRSPHSFARGVSISGNLQLRTLKCFDL